MCDTQSGARLEPASFPKTASEAFGDTAWKKIVFAPDGQKLFMTGGRGMIGIWNVQTQMIEAEYLSRFFPSAIVLTPDGESVVTGDNRGYTSFWNVKKPRGNWLRRNLQRLLWSIGIPNRPQSSIKPPDRKSRWIVQSIAIAEDSQTVAISYVVAWPQSKASARIVEMRSGRCLKQFDGCYPEAAGLPLDTQGSPLRIRNLEDETQFICNKTDRILARYPKAFDKISSLPGMLRWAACDAKHLHIFQLKCE
jgi:WD40 repeat protein